MCRICGRTVKCIFDSMPSRTVGGKRTFSTIRSTRPSRCIAAPFSSRKALCTTLDVDPKACNSMSSTFLLPFRAKIHTTIVRKAPIVISDSASGLTEIPPTMTGTSATPKDLSSTSSEPSTPLILSKSVQQLLPVLSAQKPHYITAHIHRFPYLLTAGDTLRLPFFMHEVEPGDIIRLNRASLLGSREYTLKAGTTHTETYDGNRTGQPQYLDERLFECRARVLGVDTGPMTIKEKTKRRNRRVKKAKSKHKYTVLKVMEIKIKNLEELKAEEGELLLSSGE